ncbi:MAG: YjjG family noncanonical pyrimidine nucleotidase [Clostridiales bacterium]|nr:YjjG family noncanonical pyrimidine nucleotidase [Clostridiales bacterium]
MYKFLIFDADHTLFDFDKAEKDALEKVMLDFGITKNPSLLLEYKKINLQLWKKYEKNEITQDEIKFERFRIFFNKIECSDDYKKGAENYLIYLSEGSDLLDGALDLIIKLKKDFKLGLLTNGISSVQHLRFENSSLNGMFDAVVISGDFGISKPDPQIFQILTKKADFYNKRQMLMIGDSLSSDMKGGYNFGIDTCWFNPHKNINRTPVKPTYQIYNLEEIYKIIK